jgi:3-oxoacyl-[acyl-carrier protein] reductase
MQQLHLSILEIMERYARAALVTGASNGIGRAIAIELAKSCGLVWVNYVRNADAAAETVAAVEREGARGRAIQADVAVPDDVARMMGTVTADGLDVLVNNAGGVAGLGDTSVFDIEVRALRAIFEFNLFSAVLATQHLARHLRERGAPGRVVNIGSVLGGPATAGPLAYSAAKAALAEFTKTAAVTLAPHKITVNCVAPGFIANTRSGDGWTPRMRAEMPIRIPLGGGKPADVAAAVAFLCSDAAGYVTGETLAVDGGFLAYGAYPGTLPDRSAPVD